MVGPSSPSLAAAPERSEASRWVREQLLLAVEKAWWPVAASTEAVAPFRQGLHRLSFRLRFGRDELDFYSTLEEISVLASESGVKRWQVEYHLGHLVSELVQVFVDQFVGLVYEGFLLPIQQDGAH